MTICSTATSVARNYALLLVLFINPVFCSLATAHELTSIVDTGDHTIRIIVRYKTNKLSWAKHITAQTKIYLQALEPTLGIPLPAWANNQVTINGCDACQARLDNGQVYVPYNLTTKDNPALIMHELGHYWYSYWDDYDCEDWLVEGIVSFLPVMLRRARALPNNIAYRDAIERWWAYYWNITPTTTPQDAPLCPFSVEKKSVIYWKSFRLQQLFYHALGRIKYLKFLRALITKEIRSNDAVIAELTMLKPLDWKTILTGWVYGSRYYGYKMSDFAKDEDSDGLSKVEEISLGLSDHNYDTDNDKIPDGAEVRLLRNPRKKDLDALSLLRAKGPFIDGSNRDWSYFSFATTTDPANDQTGQSWSDMVKLNYFVQGRYLYILVQTRSTPRRSSLVFFDLLVDIDNDYYTDHEFAFMLNDKSYPWHYIYSLNKSTCPYLLSAGVGRHFEMKIPLSELPASSIKVLPILRSTKTNTNLDEWSNWVPIELP